MPCFDCVSYYFKGRSDQQIDDKELNSVKEAMFNVDSPSLLLLEVLSPLIVI